MVGFWFFVFLCEGCVVINVFESGVIFLLKRRDMMFDYVLILMGWDENEGFVEFSFEFLYI